MPGILGRLELGVEQQEHVVTSGVHDQGGAGQVPLGTRAVERVVVGVDEVEDRPSVSLGIGVDVGATHGADRIAQVGRRLEIGMANEQHGPDTTWPRRNSFPFPTSGR